MSTVTETPYVICENFCGCSIREPKDHDPDCRAPAEERDRLMRDLGAKRVAATAAAAMDYADSEDEEEPESYDRLATVDGKEAIIRRGRPASSDEDDDGKTDYSKYWVDPHVDDLWIFDMQKRIDEGAISIGGVPAGKACTGKQTRDIEGHLVEIDCPHKIAMRSVRTNECDLEHKHTETLEAYCLIHALMAWGGEVPVAGAGPLFGADA